MQQGHFKKLTSDMGTPTRGPWMGVGNPVLSVQSFDFMFRVQFHWDFIVSLRHALPPLTAKELSVTDA